jgi:hypothetical protein
MKTHNYTLIALLMALLFSGCWAPPASITQKYFTPQSHNIPLFTDKNQIHTDLNISLRTVNLNLAYSPIKHMALFVNGQYSSQQGGEVSTATPEFGIGAYHTIYTFDTKKLIAELYAGYGIHNLEYQLSTSDNNPAGSINYYYNAKKNCSATKYFIQPNIGVQFSDKFSVGFSLKLSNFKYSNYFYEYTETETRIGSTSWGSTTPSVSTITKHDSVHLKSFTQFIIEPALTARAGNKKVKGMLQVGLFLMSNADTPITSTYHPENPFFIRIGLQMPINIGKVK